MQRQKITPAKVGLVDRPCFPLHGDAVMIRDHEMVASAQRQKQSAKETGDALCTIPWYLGTVTLARSTSSDANPWLQYGDARCATIEVVEAVLFQVFLSKGALHYSARRCRTWKHHHIYRTSSAFCTPPTVRQGVPSNSYTTGLLPSIPVIFDFMCFVRIFRS